MPQQRVTRSITDKAAGLESHQFSRDEHRFDVLPDPSLLGVNPVNGAYGLDSKALPRQPRVGNNSRNTSDPVFKFGNTMAYENDRERYISDVARHEKMRVQQKREKLQRRIEIKRHWMSDIEKDRWNRMSQDFVKEQQLWAAKHSKTRLGEHSVNYNPITLQYHNTDGGRQLAAEDAKATYRTAVRATRLYLKNNSFDPMTCADIPKNLEIQISGHDKSSVNDKPDTTKGSSDAKADNISKKETTSQQQDKSIAVVIENTSSDQEAKNALDSSKTQNELLQRPKYGRRSYKIHQNTDATHQLATPRVLAQVTSKAADLARSRSNGKNDSSAGVTLPGVSPINNLVANRAHPLVIEADSNASWLRHY